MVSYFRLAPVVLLAAVMAGTACKNKNTAQDYLENADRFYQQQELDKARVEYRNALALDPNSAQAHYGLAKIAREKQDQAALLFHIAKAAQLDPQNADYLFEHGELAIFTGDLQVARSAEKKLRELSPGSAHSAQLSIALAIAEERWVDADQIVDESLKSYPESAELWGLAAVSAKKQHRWERALSALDRAIQLAKDPLQYRLLRTEVNQERGDVESTITDLTALIEQVRYPEPQILQLTKLIFERDGQAPAVETLVSYIKRFPEAYALQTLHVDLVKNQDLQKAGELLDRYIQSATNPTGLLFYRVYAALANNNLQLARQDLLTIEKRAENDEKALYEARALLAELAWLTQDWNSAESYVDQVLSVNSSHQSALLLKAKLLMQQNQTEKAVAHLNKLLSLNRNSVEALAMLAAHNQRQGKSGVAHDYYQKVLQLDPKHYDAMKYLIAESFSKGHYANTDAQLSKALQAYPNDISLMSMQLQLAALRKNYGDANKILEQLQKLNADSADIAYFRGFIKQQQGNHKAAMQDFAAAVSARGGFDKALQAMVTSAQQIRDSASLKQFLHKHIVQYPADLSALLLHTRLADAKELPQAKEKVEAALQQYPDWGEGAVLLAELQRNAGDEKAALELLQTQYQRSPSAGVGIAYARFLQQSGTPAEIAALYENLLANYSDNDVVRNNYASFLLASEAATDWRKALQLTEGFANSENPALLDTYAQAALKNQNIERAIFTFQKALSIADIPDIQLHYVEALKMDGKRKAALDILDKLQKQAEASGNSSLLEKVIGLKNSL